MQPDELRDRYRRLISPDPATEHDARYPIDPAEPPARIELRDALSQLFNARPELDRVALVLGDTALGVVHRAALTEPVDPGSRSSSDADPGMLGLPGRSTHYELLYFQCPRCPDPATQALVFLNDGEPPLCSKDRTHGRTVLINR
ncbi:hypothetical protein [Kitasatospora kifunensis]|uniref:Uncharacterized protein n=1 Tax=Kitasatospora kifunensis TaxID=58351 RepID=A0A7W7QWG5_KITKI|nr:hypothetical protein [Kitasatospora kifunensis]MBB4921017.1 hypothetical protein [Kitasatospora kifunensis]